MLGLLGGMQIDRNKTAVQKVPNHIVWKIEALLVGFFFPTAFIYPQIRVNTEKWLTAELTLYNSISLVTKHLIRYKSLVVCRFPRWDAQDPQRMCETADNAKPYMYYDFIYTYALTMKFDF